MDTPKTKVCIHCNISKPEKSFVTTVARYKDKVYHYRKKICNTCKSKGYRERNPDKEKTRQQQYRKNNENKIKTGRKTQCYKMAQKKLARKQTILDAIGHNCCEDCGYSDLRAICFHHRNPTEKSFNICFATGTSMKIEAIIEEAKKCDVLCLNCHQIRHCLLPLHTTKIEPKSQ